MKINIAVVLPSASFPKPSTYNLLFRIYILQIVKKNAFEPHWYKVYILTEDDTDFAYLSSKIMHNEAS
jgi:hypothetical protein